MQASLATTCDILHWSCCCMILLIAQETSWV